MANPHSYSLSRYALIHHQGPIIDFKQAGGLAGTSVDLLFFPIDTVKTRLQSPQGFVRSGGFKGIYKGVGSVVVGSAPGGVYIVYGTRGDAHKPH